MRKNSKNKKGFTLIELLVVIAIIAILAVVVVLTLNPAELLRQARDSNRVSDFATLKSALSLYSTDVSSSTWMGSPNSTTTIYTSGPTTASIANATSVTAGCSATSPLLGGYGFLGGETILTATTTTSTSARAVNGTGWIPVNFTWISSGAPIGSLPVDPTNNGSTTYMYVGAATTYKLATKMESVKYSNTGSGDVESTDGGNAACALEAGTNLTGL